MSATEHTLPIPAAEPGASASDESRAGLRAKLFSTRGRCGVRSYHTRIALLLAALLPPTLVLLGAAVLNGGDEPTGMPFVVGMTVFTLALIAVIACSVCVTVQRLHDLGHGGWFYLVSLVPIVGMLFALYCCYVPGQDGENRFGAASEPSKASRIVGPISIALGVLVVIAYVVGTLFVGAQG